MTARRMHRIVGLVMLLPLVGWAATGAVFFIKPGYGDAYAALPLRTYSIGDAPSPAVDPDWLEVRRFRTVLGPHLLVRTTDGWRHLDAEGGKVEPVPGEDALTRLLNDAFTANPGRYGQVASVDGLRVTTDTGVEVTLDWERMTLSQRGPDTDRIDALYRVHYLQWTGVPALDRVLGMTGLVLLVALSVLGLRLFLGRAAGRE